MTSADGKASDQEPSIYAWTKEFMEAGKERLTRDTIRDATRPEIESLKRENHDLKELVADLSLEVYRFKKPAIPVLENTRAWKTPGYEPPGEGGSAGSSGGGWLGET